MADRLLDAARSCVIDIGWKRTTLTDVANRAGVSRMSVYRAFPDMETLFAELMTREWAAVVGGVIADIDQAIAWPTRMAHGVARSVLALRADELFRRAVDLDPEWLLPYLFIRRGRSQETLLQLLSAHIRDGQLEGGIRAGNPDAIARTIVLTAHGHTLSVATMADDAVSTAELDAEFTALMERYLTP